MKHKRKRQKKLSKKGKKYWELENSLRFTTGGKSTFWRPGKADKGDYVQPVTDGELSRGLQENDYEGK